MESVPDRPEYRHYFFKSEVHRKSNKDEEANSFDSAVFGFCYETVEAESAGRRHKSPLLPAQRKLCLLTKSYKNCKTSRAGL